MARPSSPTQSCSSSSYPRLGLPSNELSRIFLLRLGEHLLQLRPGLRVVGPCAFNLGSDDTRAYSGGGFGQNFLGILGIGREFDGEKVLEEEEDGECSEDACAVHFKGFLRGWLKYSFRPYLNRFQFLRGRSPLNLSAFQDFFVLLNSRI